LKKIAFYSNINETKIEIMILDHEFIHYTCFQKFSKLLVVVKKSNKTKQKNKKQFERFRIKLHNLNSI